MANAHSDYLALYQAIQADPRLDLRRLDETNTELNGRLRFLLSKAKLTVPGDTYIGRCPLGSVNASVRKTKNGYVILVNDGLGMFAAAVAQLIAGSFPAVYHNSRIPPAIDMDSARRYFSAACSFFAGRQPEPLPREIATRLRTMHPARSNLVDFLHTAVVDFVVAHEVSHILKGHVSHMNDTPMAHGYLGGYDPEFWKDELDADLMAGQIVKCRAFDARSTEQVLEGAVIFFDAIEALWWHRGQVAHVNKGGEAHPPPEARRAALICNMYPERLFYADVPTLDQRVRELAELRDEGNSSTIEAKLTLSPSEVLRSKAARLMAFACKITDEQYVAFLGGTERGLTRIDVSAIESLILSSHEVAQACVSRSALGYVSAGPATNYTLRMVLGIFAGMYQVTYTHERTYAPFTALVSECVGDLQRIIAGAASYMLDRPLNASSTQ